MALVEYKRQDNVGYITLNRAEKLDAISDEMSLALCNALYHLYDDDDAMVGIISGNGLPSGRNASRSTAVGGAFASRR